MTRCRRIVPQESFGEFQFQPSPTFVSTTQTPRLQPHGPSTSASPQPSREAATTPTGHDTTGFSLVVLQLLPNPNLLRETATTPQASASWSFNFDLIPTPGRTTRDTTGFSLVEFQFQPYEHHVVVRPNIESGKGLYEVSSYSHSGLRQKLKDHEAKACGVVADFSERLG